MIYFKALFAFICLTEAKQTRQQRLDDGSGANAYSNGMNPGMALRLKQNTVELFRDAMVGFLPEFVEDDFSKPTSYDYTFRAFFG